MTRSLGENIAARIDELAALSDEEGKLTRLYLGPAHKAAVNLVSDWMRQASMSVRLDTIGNVVGRIDGQHAQSPTLLIGSHIDSVRDAGRFDGPLGVITGLAVVEQLQREGRRLPFAVEVIAFGDEEGVRFPSTLGGSRALAGSFDPALLEETDAAGISRRDALIAFGCDPDAMVSDTRDPAALLGYVEVHIEQGPVLETENLPVGIVNAICGATRGRVDITGERGHAGTVPMALRKDALAAAAEMILAIEAQAKREDGLVATVGQIELAAPAPNSVPGEARFSLDLRAPRDAQRGAALADIEASIGSIAAERNVSARLSITHEAPATSCDPNLMQLLEESVRADGFRPYLLPSGAGHDAMAFRDRVPVAMLFVRCRGGISHHPAEFAAAEDIDAAARVLQGFIERLAAQVT